MFVSIIVPYRLAFITTEEETKSWAIVNWIIDFSFLIDMILTFFFAFEDEEKCITVEDHKTIAIRYLKSWFIFDLLSIFPFDVIMKATAKSPKFSSVNTLIRISRIGKVYKLSRFLRLSKLVWLYRNRKKAVRNIDEKTKLSLGTERFLFFGASTLLLIHLSTCLWLFCT